MRWRDWVAPCAVARLSRAMRRGATQLNIGPLAGRPLPPPPFLFSFTPHPTWAPWCHSSRPPSRSTRSSTRFKGESKGNRSPPATPSREEVQRRQAQALVLRRHRPRYASISLPIVFWTKFVLWFQLLNNCITRTKAKRHKDTFKHRRKPMTQYSCKVVYLSIPMPSSTARQTKVQIQDGRFRG